MNDSNNIPASASLPSADFSISAGQPADASPLAADAGRPSSGKSALGAGDKFHALAETLLRSYRRSRTALKNEKNWKNRPWKRGHLNALNKIIDDLNFYVRYPDFPMTNEEHAKWMADRRAKK